MESYLIFTKIPGNGNLDKINFLSTVPIELFLSTKTYNDIVVIQC